MSPMYCQVEENQVQFHWFAMFLEPHDLACKDVTRDLRIISQ